MGTQYPIEASQLKIKGTFINLLFSPESKNGTMSSFAQKMSSPELICRRSFFGFFKFLFINMMDTSKN